MYSICEHSVMPDGTEAPRKYWAIAHDGMGFPTSYPSFEAACIAVACKNLYLEGGKYLKPINQPGYPTR